MRASVLLLLTVLLLLVPNASANPLVPDRDPLSQPNNTESLEDHITLVRNTLKSLFPESAPFAPNCIEQHAESKNPSVDQPADGDVVVNEDGVIVYVLVYDTLVRITIDSGCIGA